MKHYFIHDNGGKPFVVYVGKTVAKVYKMPGEVRNNLRGPDDPSYKLWDELVIKFNKIKKIHIGKDHSTRSNEDDGNSILLDMGKNKYVYIGDEIYEFTTTEKITKFYSNIGNSDVPYSVALSKNYVYFTIENTVLPRDLFSPNVKWDDAYTDLYGHTNDQWYIKEYGKEYKKGGFHDSRSKLYKKYHKPLSNYKVLITRDYAWDI